MCCAAVGRLLPAQLSQPNPQLVQQQRHIQMHAGTAKPSAFAGASQLGGAFMAVFFTVIGVSSADLSTFAKPETPVIMGFILIMVGALVPVNMGVCLGLGTLGLGTL